MAQQTAVEVLFEKVFDTFESYHLGKIPLGEFFTILLMHRDVVMEMEKRQIIDSYLDGRAHQESSKDSEWYNLTHKDYYNKTYNK